MSRSEMTLAPVGMPRRDRTDSPPTALLPLFAALDSYASPIGKDDLAHEITSLLLDAADLGEAILIDTGSYVRALVRAALHYEVLVMAWLPGQRSPAHDHGGSCCCVRIVAGRAIETVFHLLPDGTVEPSGRRTYAPGDVCCSIDDDIHSLGNAKDCPATPKDILVTLHVYSPPLPPTRKYTVADDAVKA